MEGTIGSIYSEQGQLLCYFVEIESSQTLIVAAVNLLFLVFCNFLFLWNVSIV